MKQPRLPSLIALRAFEAVARVGSMKEASNELHVTPGAISQLIRKLEEELSIQLFERKNRELILTSAGCKLRDSAFNAFNSLKQSVQELSPNKKESALRIACESSIASNWLAPKMGKFLKAFPCSDIKISALDGIDALVRERYDLVITKEQIEDTDLELECLGNESYSIVASPSYLEQFKQDFGDLLSKSTYLNVQNSDQRSAPHINTWLQQQKLSSSPSGNEIDFGEEFEQALNAARYGAGIMLAPNALVSHDIESGRLARLSDATLKSNMFYWIGCNHSTNKATEIMRIKDWLKSEFMMSMAIEDRVAHKNSNRYEPPKLSLVH